MEELMLQPKKEVPCNCPACKKAMLTVVGKNMLSAKCAECEMTYISTVPADVARYN